MILSSFGREMSGLRAVQINRQWVERNLGFDPVGVPVCNEIACWASIAAEQRVPWRVPIPRRWR